ncbi:RecX family transcriptional regulator [Lacinutrix sp. C3R15]|uniref:regulatory protein RecX n=1 Tax=Flavobacteriaceae TaxID=49546 RepID=UPI001C090626|nr:MULTISPECIES: regulatory protein RecX [Flavobacteriaceae]MBU2940930.1 RecX family transcriptional regulator [Lacinutrix sp. C3R15]MDO6624249.1 regulatory protein RecX [Oceanihabitans sp. 1_MG-2023]
MHTLKTYSLEEAQKKLEYYCAYQERCHKEVVEKLKNMRMIPDAIDVIVVHLIQNNFLNEARFAKAFVLGKFRIKKWGKNKLKQALQQKEISRTIIDIALKEIAEEDYLETFNALAEKKVASIRESNIYKKKKKLADYLLYRGWESPLVYDAVNRLIQ